MNFPTNISVESESDTAKAAKDFAELLTVGDTVALTGNLGSGKTFFVKEVCKKFGIIEASSPSFAIVNVYEGEKKINHFDFYRIKKIEELYDIGYYEYINDEEAITFIEWAEMFPELLPKKYFSVNITMDDNSKRIIEFDKV